jgi:predicted transcriptional regulator
MRGHHPFDTLRAQMTPARRAQNAAKTQALLAALPRQALQHARAQAQAELAQCLQVQPPVIATLERRLDLYVSTLRRCLEALGGTLEVVAHFPDGSITITTFGEVDEGSDVP